eukprot:556204_1
MTLFGVTVDKWAIGNSTNIATIIIQSICFLITLTLLIIRTYHIAYGFTTIKSTWKSAALPITQYLMMLMSILYLFCHEWNYIHLYRTFNPINCGVWFECIMITHASTRALLLAFLMLRSSLSFDNSFCAIPLKWTITIITITTIMNIIPLPFIVTDFIAIQPFKDNSFCFRILGNTAVAGGSILHLLNCIASILTLILFYWKAREVSKCFNDIKTKAKMNNGLVDLKFEFKKHINLGILTVIGTILIFFFQDIFSVFIGITFALDQTVNNILTFMMFKEYAIIYKWLLCKNNNAKVDNVINMVHMTQITRKRVNSNTNVISRTVQESSKGIPSFQQDKSLSRVVIVNNNDTTITSNYTPSGHALPSLPEDQNENKSTIVELDT